MSDHFPGRISIGGPIPRGLLTELIRVAAGEGASLDGYGGPAATETILKEAFCQGAIVALCDDQARNGQFDSLETFLVKHRIHFDRYSEAFCEYNAEVVRYRGGNEAVVMPADQNGNVLLDREEVAAVLEDTSLKAQAKVKAIRRLVNPPDTEPLSPIRFL